MLNKLFKFIPHALAIGTSTSPLLSQATPIWLIRGVQITSIILLLCEINTVQCKHTKIILEYLGKHFSVAAVEMKVVNDHKIPHICTERCKAVLLCGICNSLCTEAVICIRTLEARGRLLMPLVVLSTQAATYSSLSSSQSHLLLELFVLIGDWRSKYRPGRLSGCCVAEELPVKCEGKTVTRGNKWFSLHYKYASK